MALKTLVQSCNVKAKEIEAAMLAHRENPRMVALAHEFVRLTNSEEDNAKLDAETTAPECPHDVVNRKTGKCIACGETVEGAAA